MWACYFWYQSSRLCQMCVGPSVGSEPQADAQQAGPVPFPLWSLFTLDASSGVDEMLTLWVFAVFFGKCSLAAEKKKKKMQCDGSGGVKSFRFRDGDVFLKGHRDRVSSSQCEISDASCFCFCFLWISSSFFFNLNAKTIDYYQYMQDLWMGSP